MRMKNEKLRLRDIGEAERIAARWRREEFLDGDTAELRFPAVAWDTSCARETERLASHIARPSQLSLQRADDQVQRRGFGVVRVKERITHDRRGCTAGRVAMELDALRAVGAPAVLLHVNSPGGDVLEGLGMIRALRRFSEVAGPVVAFVGQAHSMAAPVALAADHLVAAPSATFMFHHLRGGDAEQRAQLQAVITDTLLRRSFLPADAFDGWLDGEVDLGAERALSFGLVDQIGDLAVAEALAKTRLGPGTNSLRQQLLQVRSTERAANSEQLR